MHWRDASGAASGVARDRYRLGTVPAGTATAAMLWGSAVAPGGLLDPSGACRRCLLEPVAVACWSLPPLPTPSYASVDMGRVFCCVRDSNPRLHKAALPLRPGCVWALESCRLRPTSTGVAPRRGGPGAGPFAAARR